MEQGNNFSTKVTKKDIKNGIVDEFGVVYSKDGNRLLKCTNNKLETYSIKKGTIVICDKAFYECNYSIQSIYCPNSISVIGDSAFEKCVFLQQITIPDSVTIISKLAFSSCISLKQITLPKSIAIIEFGTFAKCESLQSIKIQNSVTNIGDYAFYACKSLMEVDIPNSVISIGDGVFSGCENLNKVIIPNSVTTIGVNPFEGCQKITVESNSTRYIIKNDLLTDQECIIISCINHNPKIDIPNTITKIANKTFSQCNNLKKITIPNSVTSIGTRAFFRCISLEQISIPNSITTIDKYTFLGCKNLQAIVLPNSITSIGEEAFAQCISLKQLTIPDSVITIGKNAFEECKLLSPISIPVKFRDNIRIKKIIIENFRAFQNVEIPFNNFNCVIGKNDVGKSTIFAALKWFFDKNAELTKEDFANSYFDSPKSGEDNQYTISVAVFFSGIYLPKTSPKYSKFIYDKDYLDKDNCICIRKYQDNVVDIALPQKKGYSIKTYPLKTKFNRIFSKLTSKQIKEVYREKFQDELFTDLDNYRNKRQICNKIYDYSVNEGIEPSWEEFNNSQLSPEPFYLDWLDSYQFQIYTGDTPISNYLNTLIIPHIYKSINNAKKKIKGELLDSLKKNNITEDLTSLPLMPVAFR